MRGCGRPSIPPPITRHAGGQRPRGLLGSTSPVPSPPSGASSEQGSAALGPPSGGSAAAERCRAETPASGTALPRLCPGQLREVALTLLQPALPAPAGSSWPGSERLMPAVGLVEKPNQLQGSSQGPDVQSHSAGAEAARAQQQQLALAPSIAGGKHEVSGSCRWCPKGMVTVRAAGVPTTPPRAGAGLAAGVRASGTGVAQGCCRPGNGKTDRGKREDAM